MKICLIGCGSIAWAAHGPALCRIQRDGKAELLACCDMDTSRAEDFRKRFGFHRAYSNHLTMLEREKPDLVFCLLPVALNAACAISVLERGYGVAMEKPPGINIEEACAIDQAMRQNNAYHAVLFNRRSMPLVLKAKELLSGEKIEAISLEMCRENRMNEDFTTTAIHGIDCVRFLVGKDYESLIFHYQEHGDERYANFYAFGRFLGGIYVDMRFLPCAGAVTERISIYTKGKQFYLELPVWSGTTYVPGFDQPGRLVVAQQERQILCVTGAELSGCEDGFVLNGFYGEDCIVLKEAQAGSATGFSVLDSLQSVDIATAMRERRTDYRKETQ